LKKSSGTLSSSRFKALHDDEVCEDEHDFGLVGYATTEENYERAARAGSLNPWTMSLER